MDLFVGGRGAFRVVFGFVFAFFVVFFAFWRGVGLGFIGFLFGGVAVTSFCSGSFRGDGRCVFRFVFVRRC